MKVTEKQTGGISQILSAAAATAILLTGIVLAIFFAGLIPATTGITGGIFTLHALAAVLPIAAGAIWLGTIYRRRASTTGRLRVGGGVFMGIAMILAGVLLLCLYTGAIAPEWKPVIISWQMLLILIGIIELGRVHIVWGSILTSTGVFFLTSRLIAAYPDSWAFTGNFVHTYWPVLLIIAGLITVFGLMFSPVCCGRRGRGERRLNRVENEEYGKFTKGARSENGVVDYSLVFTGMEHTFLEPVFRGGNISNVFAGLKLDLRRAALPEGVTYLKVEVVFAGVTIFVPSDWAVEIRSHSVMGAFIDRRSHIEEPTDNERRLIIIGECVLGGGELK